LSHHIKTIYQQKDILIKLLDYQNTTIEDIDLSILSFSDQQIFKGFNSVKRQLEFYHLRFLWKTFYTNQKILYKPTGKPYLKSGFLSMTHSHQRVVIAFSNKQNIGIDIEKISEKLDRVKHKFLHKNDTFQDLTDLTRLWTVKEAVYKLFDGDNLFFMDDVEVKTNSAIINLNQLNLKAQTHSFFIDNDFMFSLAFNDL